MNLPTNFLGFQSPTYTLIPKVVADSIMQDCSTGELRVLLYILGHTFGWKKNSDQISLSQFLNGITKKEGGQKDFGVGLTKKTLLLALNTLEQKNIIVRNRKMTRLGDCDSTEFSLKMKIEKNENSKNPWPWKRSAFFQIPDQILSSELPNLSGSELKVLLFVARWTSQTENQASPISLKEMSQGITKSSGEVLSKGCGISHRINILKTVAQLETKNMMYRKKINHASGGTMASQYSLYAEEGVVEFTPTSPVVENTSRGVVETTPTLVIQNIPTPVVEITPTGVVKTTPDTNTALTKEYLNTISRELTQKFYKALKIKASTKKIEKDKSVMTELLKDGFTAEQIEISFPWILKNFPDTFHVTRLAMLIGQALRGVEATQRVYKREEGDSQERKMREEVSKKLLEEFENLPKEIQQLWISKAPKLLTLESSRKAWAIGQFQKEAQEISQQQSRVGL